MPRYRITEYRGVNIVGFSASGTSIIQAKDINDAKLSATCINTPEGKWKVVDGIHYIGSIRQGNASVVEYLPEKGKNINSLECYIPNNQRDLHLQLIP